MRAVALRQPFDTLVGEISDAALAVPSMMSESERQFLYGLASCYYSGAGAIVDAGLFMGASTVCFGEGVRRNPAYGAIKAARPKPIVSLERGLVNAGMPAFFARHNIAFEGDVGDSFEPILRRNTAGVAEDVDLRVGDIVETGVVDDQIEILFLDVIKNVDIARFVMKNYMTKLIPNRSIVLQQDYFIDLLPFIKTYQECLSRHFAYVGEIGSTAIFLCTSVPELPKRPPDAALDKRTQLDLASIAMQRSVDPSRRFMMALSKMRLILKLEGAEAAAGYLRYVEGDYPEMLAAAKQPGRIRDALNAARKLTQAALEKTAAKQDA